jgi:lysyl-tRNA synthetase class 1
MDWALRWYTYEVDYEMYGKDLIESAKLSGRIVRLMGKQPPVGMNYELFLDEDGKKISKSVGKGLTVDTWVQYAPIESLLFYIFQNPRRARRLYWDVVPKCVDDYLEALRNYPSIDSEKLPEQAIWHISGRGNSVPSYGAKVNFSMVGNLISALGADSADLLKDYLNRYDEKSGEYPVVIEALIEKGMNYYRDFILPNKRYRVPSDSEIELLRQLMGKLEEIDLLEEEKLQSIPFELARNNNADPKLFFQMFYEIVLGQERGPRFGSFVKMIGIEKTQQMIHSRIT